VTLFIRELYIYTDIHTYILTAVEWGMYLYIYTY
jgi:hypothetical protein